MAQHSRTPMPGSRQGDSCAAGGGSSSENLLNSEFTELIERAKERFRLSKSEMNAVSGCHSVGRPTPFEMHVSESCENGLG